MNSAELKRAKREVRRRLLAERDAISPAERARLGSRAVGRFLATAEVLSADVVLAFWSFGSEVPTASLIENLVHLGKQVALPRIEAGALVARAYRPGDPVTRTVFGAFEPRAGTLLQPGAIDVIAVPGVAFDREGRRVGYGGGFYDRFLPMTRTGATRIGLGYSIQLLPIGQVLPAGHFDLRVDAVVTDEEMVRCRSTT
ncbi:MAG: 5-formyltetrahydrofolate cyclo-ligase [Actinomycetota bacterium]|nr:5-formyltetrahydrofolate cyclo-ligase [Actinomycetota bacterium]MDH5225314.1 5-formyltetrahydrofolate cyclo-ligase [Actinomycetota bacterium]MDH5313477.1 5-formyltetrahydrofolate cyclo-ligase [Actinomycetota bacterium]